MNSRYFVTGIGTEVGKTVASALWVDALRADYWKPVQSGDLHYGDSDKIRDWARVGEIHPEAYRLRTPASPHHSAEKDGVAIAVSDFKLPETDAPLVVEGAGGLLVPLNGEETLLDLIRHLNLPLVLVANYYLGSINHTLLSLSLLEKEGIPVDTLVFMGTPTPSTRSIIERMAPKSLGRILDIPDLGTVNAEKIQASSAMVFPD